MSSLSIFGGSEHRLDSRGGVHVVIFAGAELHRPPLAQQIIEARRAAQGGNTGRRHFVITLFGGAEVTWPTVTQEYLVLCDALQQGTVTLQDWDRFIAETEAAGAVPVHSITLFGAFEGNELPSEDRELDDLSMQQHMGNVPEEVTSLLALAIGQSGEQRLAAVRQAAATTVLTHA